MANKERLLSASKLVIALAKKYRSGMIHYDDLMATIADVPTVDAVEVVHASWKDGFCTNCKHPAEVASIGLNCTGGTRVDYKHTRFCPECGANMDGEINNDPFLFTRRNEIR